MRSLFVGSTFQTCNERDFPPRTIDNEITTITQILHAAMTVQFALSRYNFILLALIRSAHQLVTRSLQLHARPDNCANSKRPCLLFRFRAVKVEERSDVPIRPVESTSNQFAKYPEEICHTDTYVIPVDLSTLLMDSKAR